MNKEDKARIERECALLDAVDMPLDEDRDIRVARRYSLSGVGYKFMAALMPLYALDKEDIKLVVEACIAGRTYKLFRQDKVCYVLDSRLRPVVNGYAPCFTRDCNGDLVEVDMIYRTYPEAPTK